MIACFALSCFSVSQFALWKWVWWILCMGQSWALNELIWRKCLEQFLAHSEFLMPISKYFVVAVRLCHSCESSLTISLNSFSSTCRSRLRASEQLMLIHTFTPWPENVQELRLAESLTTSGCSLDFLYSLEIQKTGRRACFVLWCRSIKDQSVSHQYCLCCHEDPFWDFSESRKGM